MFSCGALQLIKLSDLVCLDLRSRLTNLQKMALVKTELESKGTAFSSRWAISSWLTLASARIDHNSFCRSIIGKKQLNVSAQPASPELHTGCSEASQQAGSTSPEKELTRNKKYPIRPFLPQTWWMCSSYRREVCLSLDNRAKDNQTVKSLPLLHLILAKI